MTVTKIRLRNFRSHVDTTIHFGDRTFLFGMNNAGKSSIVDAVLWAITGWCRGLDGAGRGVSQLINDEPSEKPKRMVVELTVEGVGVVKRGATHKQTKLSIVDAVASGRLAGAELRTIEGPTSTVQQELYRMLGCDKATVLSALDTYALIDMDHGGAKGMLLQLLDVSVEVPGELFADGKPVLMSLDELISEEQVARSDRASKKRMLADLGGEKEIEAWDGRARAEIDGDIEAVTGEIEQAAQKFGGDEARLAATSSEIGRVERALGGRREEIRVCESMGMATIEDADRLIAADDAAVASAKAALPSTDMDWPAEVARLESEINARASAIERVESETLSGACVLHAGIACGTKRSDFSAFVASERQAIESLRDELGAAARHDREVEAFDDLVDAAAGRKTLRDRLATAVKEIAEHEAALATLRETQASLSDALASDPRPRLQERWQSLKVEREALAAYERSVQAAEADGRERAKLTAEVARLERLCDVLGPKGARVEALAAAVTRFEARVADLLAVWGYTLKISLDPWGFIVNGRSATLLSRSERLRVGMALQWSVAVMSGLNSVLFDDVDMLDPKRNAQLASFVFGEASQAAQVTLVATRANDYKAPGVPGLVSYRVAAGSAKAVTPEPEPVGA